jgi:(1->4)-alpha-D-glucan 1-alpha-D-glucosylmutase
LDELIANWTDGRIKQCVIARVLAVRNKLADLFLEGAYIPLEILGPMSEHVVGFARHLHNSSIIVAFCRWPANLLAEQRAISIPTRRWEGTSLKIPGELKAVFSNALTLESGISPHPKIAVGQIFDKLPIAILTSHSE